MIMKDVVSGVGVQRVSMLEYPFHETILLLRVFFLHIIDVKYYRRSK